MTPGNGSPPGMDRFALDAGTAEGLVTGSVDVGDAPPEYRAVAAVLQALREPPESWELVGGPAVAERIAATVVAARRARAAPRPRRSASATNSLSMSLFPLQTTASASREASALRSPSSSTAKFRIRSRRSSAANSTALPATIVPALANGPVS